MSLQRGTFDAPNFSCIAFKVKSFTWETVILNHDYSVKNFSLLESTYTSPKQQSKTRLAYLQQPVFQTTKMEDASPS